MITNKYRLSEFITTFFYIGKIKYCPGTFGSLAAFPLCYLIMHFSIIKQVVFYFPHLESLQQELLSIFLVQSLSCMFLFSIGTYFSSIYLKYAVGDDPKEVVIDEVVGQMLVIILCFTSVIFIQHSKLQNLLGDKIINFIFLFLLPFSLFRFFDILKPWPINWLDKNIKGGIGIMLDDVLAAIFASVVHYAIIFILIDFVGR